MSRTDRALRLPLVLLFKSRRASFSVASMLIRQIRFVPNMHWSRFILAVLGAGVLTSMTDWFFAGDWIHKRFTYPEIWRKGPETRAILVSSLFPFVTCAGFIGLASWVGIHRLPSLLNLALLVWLIGPLPLILTNAAFIKLHRVFVASYLVGWVVKLLIAANVASWV